MVAAQIWGRALVPARGLLKYIERERKTAINGVEQQSGTPSEAPQMLQEHWSQVWNKDIPDLTDAWNYWRTNASSTPMVPLPWKPLFFSELRA